LALCAARRQLIALSRLSFGEAKGESQAKAAYFFFWGRAQLAMLICLPRATLKAPG
jgi:hypothetical protein